MKFNPFNWKEVSAHEEIFAQKGWLRVRCSVASPLYVTAQGCEALAGVETAFDLEVSEAVTFRVDAPKGGRVFVEERERTSFASEGEVFTNIDRMPDESGSIAEVTRALRQFELERRAGLRELRAEREAIRAEREALVERVQPDPEPDPKPEAEGAAE